MKKALASVLIFCLTAATPLTAMADLLNGNFEDGLNGWTTLTVGGSNPVTLATGGSNPPAGTINASPTSDQYIYTSQGGAGHSIIAQDFVVANGTNKVFFDYSYVNSPGTFVVQSSPNIVSYSAGSNQHARFDILRPGASIDSGDINDIIVSAFVTNPGDAAILDWTTVEFDASADLAAYEGQTVIFRFAQVDNMGVFSLALDNINVGVTQVIVIASDLSVVGSSQRLRNSPVFGGATIIDATPVLFQLFVDSGVSTDADVSNAATQTLPLMTGGVSLAAGNTINAVGRVIQSRINSNFGLSSGDDFVGDRYVWLKPFGSWSERDDDGAVSGYDVDTAGFVLGVDGALNDKLRLGAAWAYAVSDVESNSSIAPHQVDIDINQLILYGSYHITERTDLDFQLDYGWNDNEGQRTIALTDTVASSDYDSETVHVGMGLSRTYELNDKFTVTPGIRADYTYIDSDSYTESGAGLLNLSVDDQSAESFAVGISGKLAYVLNDAMILNVDAGLKRELIDDDVVVTAAFEGAPSASFDTEGLDQEDWTVSAGMGMTYQFEMGAEIIARYDADFSADYLNQTASAQLRWPF